MCIRTLLWVMCHASILPYLQTNKCSTCVQVYFENRDEEALYFVEPDTTIKGLLSHNKWVAGYNDYNMKISHLKHLWKIFCPICCSKMNFQFDSAFFVKIWVPFRDAMLFQLYFRYTVYGGLPNLIVVVRDSDFAKQFLIKYKVKWIYSAIKGASYHM